eukprot:CAMPEP_0197822934 /NCGR_PEP_ID=MMETSP1437-20131217/251_1 /TAXON_ID=49252 ORGANISM="Eucampia antarctica, Strain CCMP1452" /NCGR_SAMPLE_ID=MMETSP1437 /ASSEMBLY_ACC=CAM_ASM_001096 /LENGTH=171 /DNA_ID=CAMNT_0043421831 /DNA_START=32 /DNA_END=547 /DNA_ORIENTATION=+
MAKFTFSLFFAALATTLSLTSVGAFVTPSFGVSKGISSSVTLKDAKVTKTTELKMSEEFVQETPEQAQARIKSLVEDNPVLLFMKGSKLFPQCGFSNTACQILQTYNIDFHTVDVLADDSVRSGVKDFSEWPTIPQLYVAGEFVGGSDIMVQMYQNGELGEMIEKAKADMM